MLFRKRHNLSQLEDEELIRLYREEEDTEFVGELFERYTDLAFLVSMKYLKDEEEAKDVVMWVFEKLLKDLLRYEVRSFKYWLHTVVKNQCLAVLDRKTKERQKAENFQEDEQALVESDPTPALFGEMELEESRLHHLTTAIGKLKDEQRTCIELFYLQQKSYKEVVTETGYTMMQVKSYIQNGKRNLKNHLLAMEENLAE